MLQESQDLVGFKRVIRVTWPNAFRRICACVSKQQRHGAIDSARAVKLERWHVVFVVFRSGNAAGVEWGVRARRAVLFPSPGAARFRSSHFSVELLSLDGERVVSDFLEQTSRSRLFSARLSTPLGGRVRHSQEGGPTRGSNLCCLGGVARPILHEARPSTSPPDRRLGPGMADSRF